MSDPSLVDDLSRFLAIRRCVVEPTSENTLDVALPEVVREDAATLELDLYLRVWEAIHPDAQADRVRA